MMRRWMVFAVLIFAGCVSLSAQHPTQAPAGRSAFEIAQDEARCEAYAKEQAEHGRGYKACMLARSYATNVDMRELDWIIGVAPTRPHDPQTVMTDMAECDRQADNAKNTDTIPPLTPEQESIITGQARARFGPESYARRPNATRMLVYCLQERGYAVIVADRLP